ncbi:MAG: glutamate--tRNA ligase [Planctomycetota bacterium]
MGPVRTRFAPSPTGYLHIGGVRTALFNWLLTQRYGGQFILRIDDTDAERNRTEALQPILDGFKWLGINWDEGPEIGGNCGPYFQSQRQHLYDEAAKRLVATGHAYPCVVTADELRVDRETSEKAKKPYIHRGPRRDADPASNVALLAERRLPIRLKVPVGTTIVLDDLIRGHVEWKADDLGDPVILRADGRALYNFATVVDDAAMKITHIVRAAEHLSNTPLQLVAYAALGEPIPHFAHVPVVNEPNSKKKLSKRDMAKFLTSEIRDKLERIGWTKEQIAARDDLNPATVAFYKEMGYLPASLINYLARLGWSMDDHSEIIDIKTMVANFGLERVNSSSASFDPDKLYWVAGEYMKELPLSEKIAGCLPFLVRAGVLPDEPSPFQLEQLERIIVASGDRIKLFSDILQYGTPLISPVVSYDEKAVNKRLRKDGVAPVLAAFAEVMQTMEPFEPHALEAALQALSLERGTQPSLLIHALRVACTGIEVGPGVYDVLGILGRDESLRRIRSCPAFT